MSALTNATNDRGDEKADHEATMKTAQEGNFFLLLGGQPQTLDSTSRSNIIVVVCDDSFGSMDFTEENG